MDFSTIKTWLMWALIILLIFGTLGSIYQILMIVLRSTWEAVNLARALFNVMLSLVSIVVIVWILYDQFGGKSNTELMKKIDKKCEEYLKYACSQPEKTGSVTGVNYAYEGMLPHMAYIETESAPGEFIRCAGSLISDDFVITAVRCAPFGSSNKISVKLGSLTRTSDSTGTWFKVNGIIVPSDADIAFLQLDKKVQFSSLIRPICISTDLDLDNKSTFSGKITVSGWNLDESGKMQDRLQVLDANLDDAVLSKCKNDFKGDYNKKVICATHLTERRTNCQLNSGGPLQMTLTGKCSNTYKLLGVTSSSGEFTCKMNSKQTLTSTYANVRRVTNWIGANVWKTSG